MIFNTQKRNKHSQFIAFAMGCILTMFIMFLLHLKPYTFTNLDIEEKGKNKQQFHVVGHHLILPNVEIALNIDSDENQIISVNNYDFEITKINKVSKEFADKFETYKINKNTAMKKVKHSD